MDTKKIWISSIEEAAEIGAKNNISAISVYGAEFDEIARSEEKLLALDLMALKSELGVVPLLRNGNCNYSGLAQEKMEFRHVGFKQIGIDVDRFLIIRESAGLASKTSDRDEFLIALNSMQQDMHKSMGSDFFVIPELTGEIETHLRFFDSHPNIPFYIEAAVGVLKYLGLDNDIPEIRLSARGYTGDLAKRFSDDLAEAYFFDSPFLTQDLAPDPDRNTGRVREFFNASAGNDVHLLLIGDSHSYSGFATVFSFFLKRVSFFWASRASKYGGLAEEVRSIAEKADVTIEEQSERFFLRNFGKPI